MRIEIKKERLFESERYKGVTVSYRVPKPADIEEAVGKHTGTVLFDRCVLQVYGLEDQDGVAMDKERILENGPNPLIQEVASDMLRHSMLKETEKNV